MGVTFLTPKGSVESRNYSYTFADALPVGVTLASHVLTVIDTGGGASIAQQANTPDGMVTFRLAGGSHLSVWAGHLIGTLSDGQQLDEVLRIEIIDKELGPEPATTLERLQAHREKLLDAKDEAVGGAVVEVWNGRYGNKMKYQPMTYDQIIEALLRVDREIAGEERLAAGGGRRGAVGIVWSH